MSDATRMAVEQWIERALADAPAELDPAVKARLARLLTIETADEPEPVAWLCQYDGAIHRRGIHHDGDKPLYEVIRWAGTPDEG